MRCVLLLTPLLLTFTAIADPAAPPAPILDHRNVMLYADDAGAVHPVRTVDDWARRRAAILRGMQEAMGPLPDMSNPPPLDVRILKEEPADGYTRFTITYIAERDDPNGPVPAHLYVPTSGGGGGGDIAAARRPAMLALHPTHRIGKAVVAGESQNPNRAHAVELARRGYIVIAPDYVSFGDYAHYDFAVDRYVSGTMKGIVNHMRAVDVLAARDDVDAARIGVIGHSLGGHNAMFVAVFDTRLKVIVTSCGWTPFHDYYNGNIAGWTSDRYMPLLRDKYMLDPDRVPFDFYEVVAALAPRAFFTNSPIRDDNFAVAGVRKAMPQAASVYALFDAADRLQAVYPDAAHDFPPAERRAAYVFIDHTLQHKPTRDGLIDN